MSGTIKPVWYLQFRAIEIAEPKKKASPLFCNPVLLLFTSMCSIYVHRGALHLSQLRHCFTLHSRDKKGTLLSLGGCTPQHFPPLNPPLHYTVLFTLCLWTASPVKTWFKLRSIEGFYSGHVVGQEQWNNLHENRLYFTAGRNNLLSCLHLERRAPDLRNTSLVVL
jgi:hypothetical protein